MKSPAPPRPSPALPSEIVEDILLRSAPDDPASLVRAALVCRLWRRLVSDPGFRRRYRHLHPKPALLGFVSNIGRTNRFIPACSFRPPRGLHCAYWSWHAVDSRHGRVLLHRRGSAWLENENLFAVWDPITGVCRRLPDFCRYRSDQRHTWSAAVLCAGGDACDHLDCHGGPFQVVVVGSASYNVMYACVYSSETCLWKQPGPMQSQHHGAIFEIESPSALVGNTLYFMFQGGTDLLEYNLASQKMSVIRLPPEFSECCSVCVSVTEDGRLGFAGTESSKLYLWSREAGHARWTWTLSRVIELQNLLPVGARSSVPLRVVAVVDGVGVCFVDKNGSLFTIGMNSSQVVKKICNVSYNRSSYIFPYMSFFTPALRAASTARDQGRMHKVLDKEKMLSFWSLDLG